MLYEVITLARNLIHDNLQRLLQARRKPKREAAPTGCRALKSYNFV